jgi:hypothetical protein
LLLQPGPDSPFHLFNGITHMTMKVFLHFWKKVEIAWYQVCTTWHMC